jgi:acyl-CoA thioesterase-1
MTGVDMGGAFSARRGTVRAYGALRRVRNLLIALVMSVSPAVAEVRILAFGDSLTQGYGLPEAQGFVPRLQAWLDDNGADDVTIVNAGVSGDTTQGGLARIDWSLTDDVDGVIVALGGNDLLRGIDPAITGANLDGILTAIEAKGLPMILAGLPAPPNYGEDYRRAFKAMYRDLAEEHGAIYYGSFLAGMGQGRSVREIMRLMQPDGIHPNAAGVQAIVDHIGPVVLELAAEARARP